MVHGVHKARKQFFRYLEKADGMAVGLARFLDKDADLYFAGLRDETENDRLKYLLSELIRNAQALLDKIQEYEDKLDYPVIRKY